MSLKTKNDIKVAITDKKKAYSACFFFSRLENLPSKRSFFRIGGIARSPLTIKSIMTKELILPSCWLTRATDS